MKKNEILDVLEDLGRIYVELFKNVDDETKTVALDNEKSQRLSRLVSKIIDYMIDNPGALVYVENATDRAFYQTVIDFTWNNVDSEQIVHRLLSVENETLDFIVSDISERAKKLKPTFIHVDLDKTEYAIYLQEAMQAWLYGLDNAALILCFSVLENILKEKLCAISIEYVYELKNLSDPSGVVTISFGKIIKSAFHENLINNEHKKWLFNIIGVRLKMNTVNLRIFWYS